MIQTFYWNQTVFWTFRTSENKTFFHWLDPEKNRYTSFCDLSLSSIKTSICPYCKTPCLRRQNTVWKLEVNNVSKSSPIILELGRRAGFFNCAQTCNTSARLYRWRKHALCDRKMKTNSWKSLYDRTTNEGYYMAS